MTLLKLGCHLSDELDFSSLTSTSAPLRCLHNIGHRYKYYKNESMPCIDTIKQYTSIKGPVAMGCQFGADPNPNPGHEWNPVAVYKNMSTA